MSLHRVEHRARRSQGRRGSEMVFLSLQFYLLFAKPPLKHSFFVFWPKTVETGGSSVPSSPVLSRLERFWEVWIYSGFVGIHSMAVDTFTIQINILPVGGSSYHSMNLDSFIVCLGRKMIKIKINIRAKDIYVEK